MSDTKDTPTRTTPKSSGRSPSYPYIPLGKAIEHTELIMKRENGRPCSREVALGHVGLSPKSGAGRRTVAALKAFGLMEEKDQVLTPTPVACRIVEDERAVSPERDAAIGVAALAPAIHRKLWDLWGSQRPSREQMRHHLTWQEGFNKNTVEDFLNQYLETIGDAKLDEEKPNSSDGDSDDRDDDLPPKQGDFVQWESQGVLQFPKARRVTGFSEDGEWTFVEGSNTGIPTSEVTVEQSALQKEPLMPPAPPPGAPGPPLAPTAAGTLSLSVPFRGQVLRVEVSAGGQHLRREHIQKVRKYLELAEDDLEPQATTESEN